MTVVGNSPPKVASDKGCSQKNNIRFFKFETDYERVFREQYASPSIMYFLFAIAMLGAAFFTVALFAGLFHVGEGAEGLKKIPNSTLMMCAGAVDFALFFPLFLVCVLTRYFIRRIDLIEVRLTEIEHVSSSSTTT